MITNLQISDKESIDGMIDSLIESLFKVKSDAHYLLVMASLEERTLEDNLKLINEIEGLKEELFEMALSFFNKSVKDKNIITSSALQEISIRKDIIELMEHDIKKQMLLY